MDIPMMRQDDDKGHYDLIMAAFVSVLLISNIASSAKIIDWGFNLFSIRMSFDAGTLLYPLSYIFGDIFTEVYGFRRSRRVIWTGFFILFFSSGLFWLISILPGESTWQGYAGDKAYKAILGGMSSGGIVVASLIGYWTGEFTNSYILAKMKILTKGRWLWTRTVGSTLGGQIVDTGAFLLIATLAGVFPWSIFIQLFLTNYIFKCSVEILMTPATYKICGWLKRTENVDFYDVGTSFNPFSFRIK
jgi:queuosine precursor transporter